MISESTTMKKILFFHSPHALFMETIKLAVKPKVRSRSPKFEVQDRYVYFFLALTNGDTCFVLYPFLPEVVSKPPKE
jgi:hypothetical protein